MKARAKAQILEGDCNELVRSVFSVDSRSHSLTFVDNEGFDALWSTVETILEAKADILILFPTSSVLRVAESQRTWGCLDRFYGSRSWPQSASENDFLKIYTQQLERKFREIRNTEPYVSSVRVGSEQFFYDIILVCKAGPYKRAWEYLKTKLDWRDPKIVNTTLDILKGRATQIDWFLKDLNHEVESIGTSVPPNRDKKKTLTDFI